MNFVPNTFLIGAQKCGTTYLASRMDQSPDVCVCNPKEPQYFSLFFESSAADYASSFANQAAAITIDASTTYTFLRPRRHMHLANAPGLIEPVPQRIKDAAPDARFIYIMREPVARAISSYRHIARKGELPSGTVSLVEQFKAEPLLDLAGRYADQIERWFEVFPPEQFLFLRFEDLISDPDTALRTTCEFLGIDPEPILASNVEGETHGAHSLSPMGQLLQRAPSVKQKLKAWVPQSLYKPVASRLLHRPPEEVQFTDKAEAADVFAADRARVKILTGLEI